jgi:uridine kinase
VEKLRNIGMPIADVIHLITTSASPDRSVLVGIDGGAGSGKTTFTHWFAEAIKESVNHVSIIHMDNFCRPLAERRKNYAVVSDLDWKRLRDHVLIPLQIGKAARFQLYDWLEDRLKDWVSIDVGGVAIVDGVTATRRELSGYYDLRIWFSCPRDVRVSRLFGRGDTSSKEIKHWIPSEERYIASHASEKRAHLVIDSTTDMTTKDGDGWFTKRWSPPIHAA